MTNFFNDCKSIEEAKRLYHKLAIKNHPDMGGNLEVMQDINNQFEKAFNRLKNTHESTNGESDIYTAKTESHEIPSEFMDIISKIIIMEN